MKTKHILLLPLKAVLFPQGKMQVTLSDPDYLSTLLNNPPKEIGVVLSQPPTSDRFNDAGQAKSPYIETTGCLASISDVRLDPDNPKKLLMSLIGTQRFRILQQSKNLQQCWQAEIFMLEPDANQIIPKTYQGSVLVLKQIIGEQDDIAQQEQRPSKVHTPHQFDDVAWVSNRLAEFLAIPLKAQQKLMELEDPMSRLQIIQHYLKQHNIIH